MEQIRVFYEKTGRAKYISHLDMSRYVARALKRSGLPVWYTEGFNPHIYTTFAQPLSLGYESSCESFDFKLHEPVAEEEILRRLNECLSEGVRAYRAAAPVMKPEQIKWADYIITLYYDDGSGLEALDELKRFLEQEQILVMKKTKKQDKEVDIKPLFSVLELQGSQQGLHLKLRLAAGIQLNINPSLLLGAFAQQTGKTPDFTQTARLRILTEDFTDFE